MSHSESWREIFGFQPDAVMGFAGLGESRFHSRNNPTFTCAVIPRKAQQKGNFDGLWPIPKR